MYRKVFSIFVGAAFLYGCIQATIQPAAEITIEVTDFSYSPASMTVSIGQPVTLTINNNGAVEHDFVVEKIQVKDVVESGSSTAEHNMQDMQGMGSAYDLHVSTQQGGTSTLKFTPLKAGTYRFFCTVPGHLEAGMIGELIVQ